MDIERAPLLSGKRNIVLESQLPKGMEKTMEKIAELEGLGVKPEQPTESEEVGVEGISDQLPYILMSGRSGKRIPPEA